MTPTNPTVTVRNLTIAFRSRLALDAVNLDLGRGVTGLLGPNGAGKTTLLRVLATVAPADRGQVEVLGQRTDRAEGRDRARQHLGYLPQEPGFHRGFTVFEFVDYIAILKELTDRRDRHDEVRRVLSEVGLEPRAHDRIRSLSGGMRRRVAFAQALLGDPSVLLLDEPTAGLDPELRFWFRDLVSRLGQDHTVLLSTHQTEDVSAVCQRVIVLHDGRVRLDDTPSTLVGLAAGRTWAATDRDERAQVVWRTAEGVHRHLGDPPPGATLVAPTIEDGYLLLVGDAARAEAAA